MSRKPIRVQNDMYLHDEAINASTSLPVSFKATIPKNIERTPIPPRPKLLISNRNNTLSNAEAIGEFIDNAIEETVGAKKIWITKTQNQIIISDAGSGMIRDTMIDFFQFGSKGHGAIDTSDLGLFGLGG